MKKYVLGDNIGFVELVSSSGNDSTICDTARCSTGSDSKNNAGLIDYLMRHHHTSPFEFVDFTFHIKCPIFVMRHWIRHRTASVNEKSLRYSEAADEFYFPKKEDIRKQSNKNMQMTDETADNNVANNFVISLEKISDKAFDVYDYSLKQGVCREQARTALPINLYTEFFWKMDLHNLLHFLNLRKDKHAQKETRDYADGVYDLIKPIVPLSCKSFEEHVLNAITLSQTEIMALRNLLHNIDVNNDCLHPTGIELFKTLYKEELINLKIPTTGNKLDEYTDKFNKFIV